MEVRLIRVEEIVGVKMLSDLFFDMPLQYFTAHRKDEDRPVIWETGQTELHFQELGKVDEEMEESMMLDSGWETMDLEVMRGREGMLSRPAAELTLMEARNLSHWSGVMHDKDKDEEGE